MLGRVARARRRLPTKTPRRQTGDEVACLLSQTKANADKETRVLLARLKYHTPLANLSFLGLSADIFYCTPVKTSRVYENIMSALPLITYGRWRRERRSEAG